MIGKRRKPLGLSTRCSYLELLSIWESDWGRDGGWVLKLDDKPIAILTDCQYADMFWDSYHFEIATESEHLKAQIKSPGFWKKLDVRRLTYFSRAFGHQALYAFPAGFPYTYPDRFVVRGLYLCTREPRPWDYLLMWFRQVSGMKYSLPERQFDV